MCIHNASRTYNNHTLYISTPPSMYHHLYHPQTQEFSIKHKLRAENTRADELSNEAIDCAHLQGVVVHGTREQKQQELVLSACDDVAALIQEAQAG